MVCLFTTLWIVTACVFTIAECRQMCLSCQFVGNPTNGGLECSTAPRNWTLGDTRARCNFKCMTTVHFDKKSGDPTYAFRGCTSSDDETQDGCYDDEVREYCSFTCADVDYCNEQTFIKAPSKEKSSGQNVKLSYWTVIVLMTMSLLWTLN